jgi:anti-sigma factor RsiW
MKMRTSAEDGSRHIADRLPDYVAGRLESAEARSVLVHIAHCASCAAELDEWQRVAQAERLVVTREGVPSSLVLARVLAAIDAPEPASVLVQAARPAPWRHVWLVAWAQIRLLSAITWIATAAGVAAALLLAFGQTPFTAREAVLTYTLPLIAAAGAAFLYGPEVDPGLELAIATSTSQRTVLAVRYALLLAYNASRPLSHWR